MDSGRSPGRARKTRIPPKAVIETGDDQPLLTIATACLKAIANSQFVLFSFLGEHIHMSDYKIGKAVFIAAAVTLTNPSLAESPATSNQAAMTFAVKKKGCSFVGNGEWDSSSFSGRYRNHHGGVSAHSRWQTWPEFKVVVSYIDGVNR